MSICFIDINSSCGNIYIGCVFIDAIRRMLLGRIEESFVSLIEKRLNNRIFI